MTNLRELKASEDISKDVKRLMGFHSSCLSPREPQDGNGTERTNPWRLNTPESFFTKKAFADMSLSAALRSLNLVMSARFPAI